MELDEERSLPFLDTTVNRLTNGELDITVHRKKTQQVPTLEVSPPDAREERNG